MIKISIEDDKLIIRGHSSAEDKDHEVICAAVSATAQMLMLGLRLAGVPEDAFSEPEEHGGEVVIDLTGVEEMGSACRVVLCAGIFQMMSIANARPKSVSVDIDFVKFSKYMDFSY